CVRGGGGRLGCVQGGSVMRRKAANRPLLPRVRAGAALGGLALLIIFFLSIPVARAGSVVANEDPKSQRAQKDSFANLLSPAEDDRAAVNLFFTDFDTDSLLNSIHPTTV